MPYLTCPDCMVPQSVADDSIKYQCLSCFSEIVFEACTECGYRQSIAARWQTAFSCGRCEQRMPISRTRSYGSSTRAKDVEGTGYTYPKL